MKKFVSTLLFTAIMCVSIYAQMDTVFVPIDGANGGNLNNAITTAINAGTLSNTVFMLAPGSGSGDDYILNAIVTTPAAQKLTIVAPTPTPSSPPPQIVLLAGGGINWTYFLDCYGDVTLKNLWFVYVNSSGAATSAGINIEDDTLQNSSGKGENAEIDGCIFDYQRDGQNGDGCIELKCQHFRGKINNCYFRNDVDPHFRYYGRAVSWPYSSTTWHTDSLSFTNCTFANLGYAYMQESPEWSNYVSFNHCTFLNTAMYTLESSYWDWLSVTNSIFVNAYMFGDLPGVPASDTSYTPNGGSINIDSVKNFGFVPTMPGSTDTAFTDAQRHILFTNSSYNIDSWLVNYMNNGNSYSDTASFQNKPRPQPMMSKKTKLFFSQTNSSGVKTQKYMNSAFLYDSTDPGFLLPPTNIDSIEVFILDKWTTNNNCDWSYNVQQDINGVWPVNESLTYTNPTLLKAGMGGFPLGDLYNWFPTQYTQWADQEATENANINYALTTGDLSKIVGGVKKTSNNLPKVFSLSQNYPNPFNPSTIINYTVPMNTNVSLKVYNVLGQLVATLYNGFQKAGSYAANFDGSKFASGVYIYRLESNNFTQSKKMLLLK
jgi:hypothetical protein